MVTFEALSAKYGDCLLLRYQDQEGRNRLWVIDGGPSGVYRDVLRPRLERLREDQGADGPLPVDVVMVSHIDDDHINGIAQMMRKLREQKEDHVAPWLSVREVWFNSFSKLVGTMPATLGTPAGLASFSDRLTSEGRIGPVAEVVLASVNQGRDLTGDIELLRIPVNKPDPPLMAAPFTFTQAAAKVTVLGPLKTRLDALQKEWKKAIGQPAALASLLDDSVPNLSSIALLVEIESKKILLTGDALGDDLIKGWVANGGAADQPCPVDVLKMPHHGSIRNATRDLLKMFPAKHYVFSANGRYGNPDNETLEMLIDSQGTRPYAIHVTCAIHAYEHAKDLGPSSRVTTLLKNGQNGRNYTYAIGAPVTITL
ncbi:ComEC/Rec2 family competence protein [Solidesulfovibrio sp.]